jgi:hypothetical protein
MDYRENTMVKRLFIVVAILICFGVWGTDSHSEDGMTITNSTYIGVWKQEKAMNPLGGEWYKPKYPFIITILPNGKFVIRIPPNPMRITGTWKILDDGRLQISQEEQNGESFSEGPSIMVFSLQDGKLSKPPRPFLNENEKAQHGVILKKIGK